MLPMFVIEQISYSCGPLARTEKKPRSGTWVVELEWPSRHVEMHLTFALLTIFFPFVVHVLYCFQ